MRKLWLCFISMLMAVHLYAQKSEVASLTSPDKNLDVIISLDAGGTAFYRVNYKQQPIMVNSPLGLKTSVGDFGKNLKLVGQKDSVIRERYELNRIKKSQVNYQANQLISTYETPDKTKLDIIFQVSNNNIALKYRLYPKGETARCKVEKELTGFKFPLTTTTFLTPQATPMIGWKQTKPSYEEEYVKDQNIGTPSKYGVGYTFPALFHIGSAGWALVSETGVNGSYCASKLSEGSKDGLYTLAFPEEAENGGYGSAAPYIPLPGETPWRTITVGENLKPIVETTIPFDVVTPRYQATANYQLGRSTWSWLLWQDKSINYNDQKQFIDLSAAMGFQFCLIDNWWDTNIGHEKIKELADYAHSKNVSLMLWYNSNGFWNDAPQGPKQLMNTAVARKKEMAWMKSIGIKGIKVDFFGGDKQETMRLYEDILTDANDYGLGVIFHGCTIPRGWERMYPNYMSSEAVLASENLIFTQHANDEEAVNASLHPFIRNAIGSMDFGPLLLNKRHNKTNDGGTTRKTGDIFQLATTVLFQSGIQNFGITPNNLTDCPDFEISFVKKVPTSWDEVVFIDGYPGKYCLLARRSKDKWYIAGVNAEHQARIIKAKLPMVANSSLQIYKDEPGLKPATQTINLKQKGEITISIEPNGGVVLTNDL